MYTQRTWQFPQNAIGTAAKYSINHYSNATPGYEWTLRPLGGGLETVKELRALAHWILSVVGDEPDND